MQFTGSLSVESNTKCHRNPLNTSEARTFWQSSHRWRQPY